MATQEWLAKYEAVKGKLTCKIDLDTYFTEGKIGQAVVDTLEIGTIHFPTGTILACDPLIELEEGEFFGFIVDAGMGCIVDVKTQEAFRTYWTQRKSEEDGIDPIMTCSAICWRKTENLIQNTSGMAVIGSTGQCQGRTVTLPSLLLAGAMVYILVISVMMQMTRSVVSISFSLMPQRT